MVVAAVVFFLWLFHLKVMVASIVGVVLRVLVEGLRQGGGGAVSVMRCCVEVVVAVGDEVVKWR
jgi:hypothetical protein